jgi:hypothetical protein
MSSDEIEARVTESVGEVDTRDPPEPPPKEEPPLELAEIEPLPNDLWEPPPTPFDKKRAMKWIGIVLLVVLGAGAFLIFTDAGRDALPKSVQPEAKKVAREVERRTPKIGRDEFYTFSDDQGVVHIVDDLEKVPAKYRARAKKRL